jgi:hypothetical protein
MALNLRQNNANQLTAPGAFASAIATTSQLSWTGITGTNASTLMGGAIDISGTGGGIQIQSGQTTTVIINNGSAAALSLGTLGIDMASAGANLTIGPSGGQITLFNASTPMNVGTGRTLVVSATITGAGFGFSKTGAGIALLSGANTGMTGLTTLNGGSIQVGNAGALGGATATLLLISGTISSSSATVFSITAAGASTIGGNVTLGSATLNGTLTFPSAFDLLAATRTLTINSAVTLSGIISNGGIIKAGTAALTLSGANTFGSGVSHSVGAINIGNNAALGTGKFTWSGGTLNSTSGAFTITNPMDLSGTLTWSFLAGNLVQNTGAVTLLGTTTFTGSANTLVINGIIGDGGLGYGITRNAAGSALQLGGANTFTGPVTATAATLRANGPTAFGPAGNTTDMTAAAGGTLDFNTGASATYTARTTKIAGAGVGGTSAALFVLGSSITATLKVELQAAATIAVSNSATLAGTINTTPVSTDYALTAYANTSSSGTITAVISGGGSFTAGISGVTGTVNLNAVNLFTGSVTADYGTLGVTNLSGLGPNTARSFTVNSGAALSTALALNYTNLNTFIGGTGVSSGGAVLITGNVTVNLGVVTLTAATTIRSTSTTGFTSTITNAGYDLTATASASNFTATYARAIVGAGGLIVNSGTDVGTIVLSSTLNNYLGNTTVSAGTLSITGLLGNPGSGTGVYVGAVSVATGSFFAYNSSNTQVFAGTIGGLGSFQRTTGTGVLTLAWANTLSTVALLGSGTTVVLTIGTVASPASPLGTNTQISLGTSTNTGVLRYTGATLSTDKTFYLAATSTGSGAIESSGSGALTISSNLGGASSASNRTLSLRGTYNAAVNEYSGNITNVGGGAGIIAVVIGVNGTPVQNTYWKLSGTNTFSAGLNVFSGIGEVTSAAALGSGTVNVSSNTRNASLWLRFSGDTTVTNTITASANVWGGDAANSPLGFIRTVAAGAAVIFSGTVTTSTIVGVYADQSDLTFSNTISAVSTFATRAASGRTITLSGGTGSTTLLGAIGPGKTVWKGANTSTASPQLSGGTLSVVLDGTASFASSAFGIGQSGTTTLPSQRYAFTGGVLEFDNVGATGTVSKTWSGATSVTRGPTTLRIKRTETQTFSVTIGTLNTNASLSTVEYSGSGTVGTDFSFNASAVGATSAAVNTWAPGLIISNGSTLVPAAWTDSTSYITFPVYGTTTNFTTQGASSSGLTVATGTTQNVNVTDFITGQNTVAMRTVRLNDANSAIALNSGQRLYTALLMDMGATPSRTAITGGTLGTSGNSGTLHLYTANTGGATIASAIDKRAATTIGLNGTGSFIFSGAVRYLSALQHNSANATFSSTFALPFASLTQSNPSESADAITMTLGSGAASLASLSGGGANTTFSLAGGDLTLTNYAGSTSYYAGAITRTSTQKLIFRMYSVATQNLHGALSVPLEFVRGQVTIAPIYGATASGSPTVTFSGNSTLSVDMGGSTLNSDYSLTFGALSLGASLATIGLVPSSNDTYTNTLTFASLSQTNAATVNFSPMNSRNLTVFTTPPSLVNNIVGPWGYSGTTGFLTYRTSGTFTSNGSAVPVSGSIDYLNYGPDSNTTLITTGTPVPAVSGSNNVSVTTTPITAQTSASAYTLRLNTTMIVAAGQAFKTNAILSTAVGNIVSGADPNATLSTIDGDLYLIGSGIHTIKVTDNGLTPTRVILSTTGTAGLTSTASDYTGGTLIYSSLPATTTDAMFGAASGSLTFNGSTFAPSANFTTARNISIVGAGLTFSHATGVTVALNGALSGDGILRFIVSGGATTISGSNSLSGFVNVGAGTITITNDAALGTTSEIDMAGGTLVFASGVTSFDSSRFSTRAATTYNINNSSGTAITFSAGFGNNSTFIKTGTSDIVLGGTNGLAVVTISAGALVVTNAFALGYGDSALVAAAAFGTSLVLRGSFTMPALSTSAATRTYTLGGTGYAAGGYNGVLWADSGTVTVPGNASLSTAATIGTGSTGGLILNGAVNIGASLTLTARVDGTGNIKMTGVVSGTGTSGITKTGDYTLELAPAASSNTYAGITAVQGGKLLLTSETPDTVLPVPSGSAVTLAAGTSIQTSTGVTQKGRVTLASLDNSNGATIYIGSGTNIDASRAFIYAPTTDFLSASYPIALDTDSAATEAGSYAIIYSPVPLTNYSGATVSLTGSGFVSVSSVTTATTGDIIYIGGVQYYAVVVTLADVPATSTIDPANAFVFGPSSDFKGQTFPIVLDLATVNTPGKYALFYSTSKLTDYAGASSVTFSGATSLTATATPAGTGEVVSIGGTKYYAVVVTVV